MRNWLIILGFLGSAAMAQQSTDAIAPEGTTALASLATSPEIAAAMEARAQGRPVLADRWMIAAAHPAAADAGAQVLRAGGTAADALVAVQLVLGLV